MFGNIFPSAFSQLSNLTPTGPTVTIYSDGNYQGLSQTLSVGRYNDTGLRIGNDSLSSLKVPKGLKVTLYEHENFQGRSKTFIEDAAFVGADFNDITSSIIIEPIEYNPDPNVIIYSEENYQGLSQTLLVGRYNVNDLKIGNDALSSLKVPNGWRVRLYEHQDFQGRSKILTENATCVVGDGFDNITSSIVVEDLLESPVIIYEDINYQGVSETLSIGRYNVNDLQIRNDALSSLKVPKGRKVTIYEHQDFQGSAKTFIKDSEWVGIEFDDITSSIIVEEITYNSDPNVIIYSGENYQGLSQTLLVGRYNVNDLKIGNDALSSLKVPKGWKVTLYSDMDFHGRSRSFTENAAWLGGEDFNDITSSIVVESLLVPHVIAYEDKGYQGFSETLPIGRYNDTGLRIGNDKLSSLIIPRGLKVTLYEHKDFQGRSRTFTENTAYVGDDFNDITSSIVVELGQTINKLISGIKSFNGTSDYIDLGTLYDDYTNNYTNGFSVSTWVKYDSLNQWSRIIDFGNGAGSDNIVFANIGSSKDLMLSIRTGSNEKQIIAQGILETGVWMHLAATVDSLGNAKLYKNGAEVASSTGMYKPLTITRKNSYIGKSNWSGDALFSGKMTCLKVCNYALYANQVKEETMKFGLLGAPREFSGTSADYIDLGQIPQNYSRGMTVAAWVKYDSLNQWSRIIDFGNGADSDNIVFANIGTSKDLVLSIRNGSSEKQVIAKGILETGVWMHLAATVDSSGNAIIYKNGKPVSIITGMYKPLNITRKNNYIGKSNWACDAFFDGQISNLVIYNRALDILEMNAQMWSDPSELSLDAINLVISKYAPIVYLHPDEKYKMSSVDWYLQNATLVKKGGTRVPASQCKLPTSGEDWEYWLEPNREDIKLGNMSSACSYVHVKYTPGTVYTDIQFWFFYPFNGPGKLKINAGAELDFIVDSVSVDIIDTNIDLDPFGRHVGDWEHITMRINNFTQTLQSVYLAQHDSGEWYNLDQIEKENGRYVFYSSKNGHASYTHAGDILSHGSSDSFGIKIVDIYWNIGLVNATAKGDKIDCSNQYQIISADYVYGGGTPNQSYIPKIQPPDWFYFNNRWGQKLPFNTYEKLRQIIGIVIPGGAWDISGAHGKLVDAITGAIYDEFPSDSKEESGPTGLICKGSWNNPDE